MSSTFPTDNILLRFSGQTHVGLKRAHNEDSLYLPERERLAIVADGMGGHASGEVASKLAVDSVAEYMTATAEESAVTWPYKLEQSDRYHTNRLVVAIKLANLRIHEESQRRTDRQGMGTTIVASLFLQDKVLVGHVGDSRVYRFRDRQLTQLTEDHSLLNDYMRMKRMSAEEVENFPHKNVIVRALGMRETVQVDVIADTYRPWDIYVSCSDGLSGMIEDGELGRILHETVDLDEACDRLIRTANEHGGIDNITCVLARVEPVA